MSETTRFVVRCRAVIIHEGKLLVVRHHAAADFFALPGGHLESGEDALDCIKREVIEELGVEPVIGKLLYVNTFMIDGVQSVEFFFEIANAAEYVDFQKIERSHAHELHEVVWASSEQEIAIKPKAIEDDLRAGRLISAVPRFIKEGISK